MLVVSFNIIQELLGKGMSGDEGSIILTEIEQLLKIAIGHGI